MKRSRMSTGARDASEHAPSLRQNTICDPPALFFYACTAEANYFTDWAFVFSISLNFSRTFSTFGIATART